MFIHEIPRPALVATLAECARVLAPGGLLRFLDFTRTGDAFRDLAMMEHGERNNEPFMPGLLSSDVPGLCAAAGLRNAHWVAFDERGAGRLDRKSVVAGKRVSVRVDLGGRRNITKTRTDIS